MSTPQGAQASEGCIQSEIGKQLQGEKRHWKTSLLYEKPFAGINSSCGPLWKRNTDGFSNLMRLETRQCLPFEGRMTRNSASEPWNYTAERSAPLYLWQGVGINPFPQQQHLFPAIKDCHSQLSPPLLSSLFWCLISSPFILFKIHISTQTLSDIGDMKRV